MPLPARSALVSTNERCNQNCVYCDRRSAVDDLAAIAAAAVCARIDAALAGGATQIVLTGGEPTLRRDLEALVAHARARGADKVALETNATAIDGARARALAAAGLAVARVNLAGASAALDEVTRDPGGFERTLAGMRALTDAGVRLEILTALVRATLPLVSDLPALLAERFAGAIGVIELTLPVDGPEPEQLLAYEEAVPTLLAFEAAARARGLAVKMSPAAPLPPCVLPPRARREHLYSFTPGVAPQPGHRRLAACARCLLADRCSGLAEAYLARHAPPPMHPITEERARRRLSLVATQQEQIAHELVSRSLSVGVDGEEVYDEIVRVNFHCNQACSFCFVSTHLPAASGDAVEGAIRRAAEHDACIVLSGGEPTLNPRLVDYVALARGLSRHAITLQTNAVRLDDARLTAALVGAGVTRAFVSLHGCDAEVSDGITEAPGTFVRTLAGIDQLRQHAVDVTLNFVVCEANRAQPPAFVRLVAARWPDTRINFSFVAASTDVVPRERRLIPRYRDVLPALAEAVREAARLGVALVGFESMCGLPLCLVPEGLDALKLVAIPPGFDRGEFVRAPACERCAERTRCYGVRRGYAELHGTDELHAL